MLENLKLKYMLVNFDLDLKDKMILIRGFSGTGKSFLYKALEAYSLYNDDRFVFLDWRTARNIDISMYLKKLSGKVIVIDNADIILSDEDRLYISMDTNNQYIIMCHNITGFKPGRMSFALISEENRTIKLEYLFNKRKLV